MTSPSPDRKPFDAVMQAFDLLYNGLPGAYNGLVGALGYRAPELVAAALPADALPDNPVILDAGCGTGLTAGSVRRRFAGARLHGFDLSEKMLNEARKTDLYLGLKTADATQTLPFAEESFDAAVSSGLYTLGHVGPEALAPVIATLKPGGVFSFNVFEAAWEKLNFQEAIDRLLADGLVTVWSHEKATHFGRIGQTCRVLVLAKAA